MWQIEIYNRETKQWILYGKASGDYDATYKGCVKLCEAGYKARVKKLAGGTMDDAREEA